MFFDHAPVVEYKRYIERADVGDISDRGQSQKGYDVFWSKISDYGSLFMLDIFVIRTKDRLDIIIRIGVLAKYA